MNFHSEQTLQNKTNFQNPNFLLLNSRLYAKVSVHATNKGVHLVIEIGSNVVLF